MEPFETYEHAGVTVELHYDDTAGGFNPREDHDNAGTILSFTRNFDGDEYLSVAEDLTYDCPVCEGSGENQERYHLERRTEADGWIVVGAGTWESMEPEMLRAIGKPDYDAFGVGAVRVNPTDCPHCDNGTIYATVEQYIKHEFDDAEVIIPLRFDDYGSSGSRLSEESSDNANAVIYVTTETLQKEWSGDREAARKCMLAEVKEYTQWMSGEVYGYVIKDADGNDLPGTMQDSCWGFIGDSDYVRSEANSAAEGVAEALAKERRESADMAARDIETVES